MKKKYVVYYFLIRYIDDFGCIHFNKNKLGEFDVEEDAIIESYIET